jgi:8-oxo-dGTP pyrophosphatase MutT (NUDIX family)
VVAELAVPLRPPSRPWRVSSRLLVVDSADRLLLIRAYDPYEVEFGDWWEIPGGGVEPGEDTVAAAIRETAEETGYVIDRGQVGPPCWTGDTTYRWARRRRWASLVMHLARIGDAPRRRPTQRIPEEQVSIIDVCWVPTVEIVRGRGRYFPASLPGDLPRVLAGERVDAGFAVWS